MQNKHLIKHKFNDPTSLHAHDALHAQIKHSTAKYSIIYHSK